jgi:hydroxyacylglutathione hydrolase
VLAAREVEAKQQIEQGAPTIPVTIGDEKLANPFLRADLPDVAAGIGMAGKQAAQVFAEIRARKNRA